MSNPSGPPAAPLIGLSADQVARAFPFHLQLDAGLRVLAAGAALQRACPGLAVGAELRSLFIVKRPRAHASLADWYASLGQLCTLRSRHEPPLTLRGSAEQLGDGSLLLLVSPVLGALDEVGALGLELHDFAKHDAAVDLLLLARTTQLSARDAERLAERLRERTTQLDTMLELSDSATAYFDSEGLLQQANALLSTLLNLPPGALLGRSMDAMHDALRACLAADEPERDPLRRLMHDTSLETPHGTLRVRVALPQRGVLEIRTRRSPDHGRLFFLRDVTRESEVDRMKSEFLSAAAHELRTPMASIYGFTELLLHRPAGEAQRQELLATIHRQTGQLIHIVNELLDLARIESRQGPVLQRAPARLASLVERSISSLQLPEGQRIEMAAESHAESSVLVDAGKFQQAMLNVLSNASKFSSTDSLITIGFESGQCKGRPAVGVCITDAGIGMTQPQLERIFERFYRADSSRSVPGSGLGMSLVREIVAMHGGEITLTSQPGAGTQVTLWWPIAAAGDDASTAAQGPLP